MAGGPRGTRTDCVGAEGSAGARRSPCAPAAVAGRTRSLLPKEHGAYAQFALPIVGALVAGSLGVGAVGYAVAASALFFAHEPLLVLLGQRGGRALSDAGARARTRLFLLSSIALSAAAVGYLFGGTGARWSAGAGALLSAAMGGVVMRRWEKTTGGEVLAAVTLPFCGVPVALAGGVPAEFALWSWLVWSAVFVCATLSVRAVIARSKRRRSEPLMTASVAVALLVACLGAWGSLSGAFDVALGMAAAPVVALSLAFVVLSPHARHLRRMGWMLMGASTATLCLLILASV